MKDAMHYLKQEGGKVLSSAEDLQNAVTHLKYEGRGFRSKNIKAVKCHMKHLKDKLKRHCRIQERIVFPYLRKHVPKHELSICFLITDHAQITKGESEILARLRKCSQQDYAQADARVHESGISLVYLVRHHLEFEKRSIHKALRHELNPEEKIEIRKRMVKWLKEKKL